MSPVYNDAILRSDAQELIPDEVSREIIQGTKVASVARTLMRTVLMGTKQTRMPVLSALPVAYWVNGDTGLKQTSGMSWDGITMVAEELAVIVPIPEAVLADADYPLWAEVQPAIAEAIAVKLDQAVFSGLEKPTTWPPALIPGSIAAGNENTADSTPAEGGFYQDLIETFDAVEEDGYDVNGIAARRSIKSDLRGARDSTGQRLMDVSSSEVEGVPISYVNNEVFSGAVAPGNDVQVVLGDYRNAILGVRQDLTYKMLDQAVITDDAGVVILNLPQQDAVAMRVVARFAFQVAKPIQRDQGANPYPFSVLHAAPAGP
jgi:HK97 family phage major capsid protein